MSNRQSLNLATFGPLAIGLAAHMDISGSRVLGCSRRPSACYGHLVIGAGGMASTYGTPVTGGPHVGFYGGVNYGFGYGGVGYEGGRWENGVFAYNRTVNNFGSVTITNVYEKTVIVDPGATRVSFNGGSGGTTVRPTPEQEAVAHEQHVAAIPAQLQHERTASANKALLASENRGQPTIAATAKPNELAGEGVVAARQTEPATPVTKPTSATAVGPNPTGSKALEKEEQAGKNQTMLNGGVPTKQPKTETKSPNAATSQQPHPNHPEQAAIKPASPPPPSPHGEQPAQATIKPTPAPPSPPHAEHPEQAAIKPCTVSGSLLHAEQPSQAGIKPVPSPQPPSAAPTAAKPSPPPNKPGCRPGKTLAGNERASGLQVALTGFIISDRSLATAADVVKLRAARGAQAAHFGMRP